MSSHFHAAARGHPPTEWQHPSGGGLAQTQKLAERFGPAYRLQRAAEYQAVFNQRQHCRARCFSIHVRQNARPYGRLGLAVSKKVSKRAVERNRIKRQIRESFRLRQPLAANAVANTGLDFVVVAKPVAATMSNALLRSEIDTLWMRAQVRCKK